MKLSKINALEPPPLTPHPPLPPLKKQKQVDFLFFVENIKGSCTRTSARE
jgi:hypothetical protein